MEISGYRAVIYYTVLYSIFNMYLKRGGADLTILLRNYKIIIEIEVFYATKLRKIRIFQ